MSAERKRSSERLKANFLSLQGPFCTVKYNRRFFWFYEFNLKIEQNINVSNGNVSVLLESLKETLMITFAFMRVINGISLYIP